MVTRETQPIIRINVPWYEPFEVETKRFGNYRIQLVSVSVDETTVIQIAAAPVKTKHSPENEVREMCGLSGGFETQEQAIQGWENGFVVMALDDESTADLADAILISMLRKRRAELLTVA